MAIALPLMSRPRIALPRVFATSQGLIPRQAKLAFKDAGCRAFHHNRGPFTLPFNDQMATLQLHVHSVIQQAT